MEKIYDAPANYDDVINYVQITDSQKLNSDGDKLVILIVYQLFSDIMSQ